MWGKEVGKWLAEGHTIDATVYGRMFDAHQDNIHATLSESNDDNSPWYVGPRSITLA